jgi:hypothetical protein
MHPWLGAGLHPEPVHVGFVALPVGEPKGLGGGCAGTAFDGGPVLCVPIVFFPLVEITTGSKRSGYVDGEIAAPVPVNAQVVDCQSDTDVYR